MLTAISRLCNPWLYVLLYENPYLSNGTNISVLTTIQGPVVQNIVSLTSSLVAKMLTVLVSTISNSQVFLLIKCE